MPMALDILFEDDELMVLDKPAGLVVHPAPGNWSGTLLNGLLARHAVAASLPRAGIVHRLDKDTSGLMVVGKTLRGRDRAVARHRRARGTPPLPGAGARPRRTRPNVASGADRPRPGVAHPHGRASPAASRRAPM